MKKTVLLCVITFFLFSCEKEKQLTIENQDIPLLSKVLINGEPYFEYSYTKARLISEEKSKFHYTRHSFNDKNQLIKSEFYVDPAMYSSSSTVVEAAMNRKEWINPGNTAKSLTKTYDYDDQSQLLRVTFIRPSVINSEYSEYAFENGRISRQTMYWKNELSGYIDYSYDDNDNLAQQAKYRVLPAGNAELQTTTEYEYDNKKNPYQSFSRLMTPGKYTNPNNILKETYTIHFNIEDPFIQKVQVTTNSYKYNSRGYPIKVNNEAEYIYR